MHGAQGPRLKRIVTPVNVNELLNTVEHRFADNNGVKIHYAVLGNGPPVVMIHGFPDFWFSWRHQMPALAKRFTVAAVDLRGYNMSDKPVGIDQYRMPYLVSDIAAVIADLGFSQATIVGHDWGGMVAWAAAIKCPQIVKRLIVCNLPHPHGLERELANNPAQRDNSQYARDYQKENAHIGITPEKLAQWYDPAVREHYVRAFEQSNIECMLHYYKANFPREPYRESSAHSDKVRCAVLMIHGLADQYLLPGALNDTWNWLEADMTLVTVPGAGHFVQHDAPEFVTRQMETWLQTHHD